MYPADGGRAQACAVGGELCPAATVVILFLVTNIYFVKARSKNVAPCDGVTENISSNAQVETTDWQRRDGAPMRHAEVVGHCYVSRARRCDCALFRVSRSASQRRTRCRTSVAHRTRLPRLPSPEPSSCVAWRGQSLSGVAGRSTNKYLAAHNHLGLSQKQFGVETISQVVNANLPRRVQSTCASGTS